MPFLYETFDAADKLNLIPNQRINVIDDNLSSKFPIRDYQIKAFSRFHYFLNADFPEKQYPPFHLLFNMATGSGKTLVIAGLMLYLYQLGYRNFLFFVNSNNIIKKTRDNFINQKASKYLFRDKIMIDGTEVYVKETDTFEIADQQNINIKFTTIQQLHIDLNNAKENSITYEDFKDKKIILIADEAHHLNSAAKNKGELFGSWEGTVVEVLKQNIENILLEFTATLAYESREISSKYQNKVIYKYDLTHFRKDRYSKEINLIRSFYDEQERILQALILNLYRQELATLHHINLKPVILFKAKKTIKESELNKLNFHKLIDSLTNASIDKISATATVPIVQKAFTFFKRNKISSFELARRIKSNFRFENCISANSDDEAEKNQLLLNTLEDENNPIRAVFAVQKLNEGWDVLNLFDIVRLYEGQNTGGSNATVGTTTLSEAQLIGRGARYFPFKLDEGQDKFKRKYDNEFANDLKILEELYYHTKEDSRYISELRKALIETGIYEDDDKLEPKQLVLKDDFKRSDFYKYGSVVFNKRVPRSYDNVTSITDLGVSKTNYKHTLASGFGKMTSAFFEMEVQHEAEVIVEKEIKLSSIPKHVIREALARNPFYYYSNLEQYFPAIQSISNFIESKNYLGGLTIVLSGTRERIEEITHYDYLIALQLLFQTIEQEIKTNLTSYQGSAYLKEYVHNIFKDKEIRVPKDDERADGQEHFLLNEAWYVYNANYGTSEEKAFVKMFAMRFESLNKKFKDIYLIRNEREVKIIDKLGRAFEPDFILFCKQKGDEELTYQVFIEPKGKHLVANDKWKEGFLTEIKDANKIITIDTDRYKITGVPFYNYSNENEFKSHLEDALEVRE